MSMHEYTGAITAVQVAALERVWMKKEFQTEINNIVMFRCYVSDSLATSSKCFLAWTASACQARDTRPGKKSLGEVARTINDLPRGHPANYGFNPE